MKITKLFGIVIGLHLGVIALLIVQPGCTTTTPPTRSHTQQETTATTETFTSGELIEAVRVEEGMDPAFNAGIETERFDPTRPETDFSSSGLEPFEPMQPDEGPVVAIVEDTFTSHTVVRGDSLWKISRKYNVDLNDLIEVNGMEKNSVLQVGQVIQVPAEGSQAAVATISADSYQPTTLTAEATRYTVQAGDTLSGIARKHGSSIAQIKAANNLSGDVIRTGLELVVPEAAVSASASPVSVSGATHTVRAGEYPGTIAQRYGMTATELMELNGISDPRALQVGRVLQVRGSAAPASAPVPTTLPEPAVDAQLPAAAPQTVALPAETQGPIEIRVVNSEPVELVPESPEIPEADFGDVVDVPVVRMQE